MPFCFCFCFLLLTVELDHLCGVENFYSAQGQLSYHLAFYGEAPTRQLRTPHGASQLVQAMSSWLVTIQRARFRHSRDARVYGRTTTFMHKLSTPPLVHAPTAPRGLDVLFWVFQLSACFTHELILLPLPLPIAIAFSCFGSQLAHMVFTRDLIPAPIVPRASCDSNFVLGIFHMAPRVFPASCFWPAGVGLYHGRHRDGCPLRAPAKNVEG